MKRFTYRSGKARFRMHTSKARFRRMALMSALTLGAAAGLLLPAVGRAAPPGDVAVATSTGGLVAFFSSGGPKDGRPKDGPISGQLVVPGGTTTVAQPQVGSADFAKPWTVFKKGSAGTCYAFTNPSSWSAGEPVSEPTEPTAPGRPAPLDGVSFDTAACPNDGSGFQHYRVTFTPERYASGKLRPVFNWNHPDDDGVPYWWGPGFHGPTWADAVEESASSYYALVYLRQGWSELTTVSVCGFKASGSKECWPGWGNIHIDPSLISVIVGKAT